MRWALVALLALACGPRLARAQDGLFARLAARDPALASADAQTRRDAAGRLALVGPHDALAAPLGSAIEHEAVPETLAAMIQALARRADESDVVALALAWERAAVPERRAIAGALDAIGGDTALPVLRQHLASEGARSRSCDALVRTEARLGWLAATLDDPALRDRVVSCIASAAPSAARDAALVRAGLDLEPTVAREVLRALARAQSASEEAIALAETAMARSDATLIEPALDLLARHAPERVPLERWRGWLDADDARETASLRALLVLAPAEADVALDRMRARGAEAAARALGVLLERDVSADGERIARFVEVPATRAEALDALVERDRADILAALPPSPDADLALALAHPAGDAHAALLARSVAPWTRALTGDVDERGCIEAALGVDGALCLVLAGGAQTAARALETERDARVVGWLALAAGGAPQSVAATQALLDADETCLAGIGRIPDALPVASAAERRQLVSRLVRATRHDDPLMRAEAVRALGALGSARHRAVIVAALEDPAPEVRLAAALALPPDQLAGPRALGRARIETDPRVAAALRGERTTLATAPLHVRIAIHDASIADDVRATILLADGRVLRLAPVDGEILVPRVPDAPAIVRLGTAGRH